MMSSGMLVPMSAYLVSMLHGSVTCLSLHSSHPLTILPCVVEMLRCTRSKIRSSLIALHYHAEQNWEYSIRLPVKWVHRCINLGSGAKPRDIGEAVIHPLRKGWLAF